MSIRLYYSHRTEDLAEKLADNIRSEHKGQDPFLRSTVIIPNKNIEAWLKMGIARRNTISGHADFPFLEKGLWGVLAGLDPAEDKPELLNEDIAQMLVLGEILGIGEKDKELEPLRHYLYRASKERPIDYYRKAWQLSDKLARCFREYEYNRQKLIDAWLAGKYYYHDPSRNLKSMERCQRDLYMRIFSAGGACEAFGISKGRTYLTLPQYERRIFHGGRKITGKTDLVRLPIHIFGLSQISEFHTRLLFEIGRHLDVRLYQINVCSEFWEDVTTPQEDVYRKFKNIPVKEDVAGEYIEPGIRENRLLKLWGKPGRENVKLLSDLEEACSGKVEFDSDWVLPAKRGLSEKATVLSGVQDHILQRTDRPARLVQDTSIQIFGAPGIYREAEAVYNSIIDNMRKNPGLLLTDIAILVSSMEDYAPVVKSVFSRQGQSVPFNMSDISAPEESIYAQAILSLLDLVESSFSRRKVFSLFLNDCFLAAMRISREDALIWLKWADRLNIFHSFDLEDKKRHSVTDNRSYTWSQGLIRLRLGRIMDTDPANGLAGSREYKGMVPFSDIDSANPVLVGDFSIAVETLCHRLAGLAGMEMSCKEWALSLRSLIDQFLAIPYGRNAEEKIRDSMRYALEALEELDLYTAKAGKKGVGFGFVLEYIKSSLSKIGASRGRYLSGGVTISSLLPMRPIPFKIVYVMGLGEGYFPGAPDRSTLDLRHYKRRIGDVSIDEANRYLFLETLMSVREKLYLTYVSRDTQRDEALYPCSVVNELRGYLDDHILNTSFKTLKDNFAGWSDDIPLKGSSPGYLLGHKDIPLWSDILANYSVPDRLACISELSREDRSLVNSAVSKEAESKKRDIVKWDNYLSKKLPGQRAIAGGQVTVRIKDLADFLVDPAEASLKRHLGIYEREEEDLLSVEDEPFRSVYPVDRALTIGLSGLFIEDWQRSGQGRSDPEKFIDENLERLYEHFRLSGYTPDGVFCNIDKKRWKEAAKKIVAGPGSLRSFLEPRIRYPYYSGLAIGDYPAKSAIDKRCGPVSLKVLSKNGFAKEVDVNGELQFVWHDDQSSRYETVILKNRRAKSGARLSRDILTPILFYIGLKASGAIDVEEGFNIYVFDREGIADKVSVNVTPPEAKKYLSDLLTDYLDEKTFDLLPLDVVKKTLKDFPEESKPDKKALASYRLKLEEEILQASTGAYSSYRPSAIVSALDLRVPEDAYSKVSRRIKWIYDKLDE
ncbi:MAG: exodeoxyribonuclease V subunit gamma [Candidatus Omnitrophica bacterium]|nr:exodeoxyribonuclease V subunit gamma [Candidatus Omnitrophota bacterium]